MRAAEQIFRSSQGLKTCVLTEVERSEPPSRQEAVVVEDRMESLFSSICNSFTLRGSYNERNAAKKPIANANQKYKPTKNQETFLC